jgi:hypothetical protein
VNPTSTRHPRADRGQTLPLVALLLAVAVAVATGVAHLATRTSARERAEGAADAVALAGAVGGHDDAARVAAANDAFLVDFTRAGDVVTVEVRRGEHRAVARATARIELTGR